MGHNKLNINILSKFGTRGIPILIEIKDAFFNIILSRWITDDFYNAELKDGVYVIEAKFSSGEKVRQVVDLKGGVNTSVNLDLYKLSPHESQEWAFISQKLDPLSDDDLFDDKYSGSWVRMWTKEHDGWRINENPIQESSDWNADGVSYHLEVYPKLQALQVGGKNIRWKFVMLPPGDVFNCLIRPVKDQSETVHPLEVVITTNNWKAETLLSFLNSGDMDKAKSILEDYAEELLFSKMANPTGAAIGGYALLKVGSVHRMRNWASNLSNWIEWMPDGPIIQAWKLINEKSENIAEIKSLFLEAVKRGIPIYTEGFRLLMKGLKMLYYQDKGDSDVKSAYLHLRKYWEAIDFSSSTTTFTGIHPENPSPNSRLGLPENRNHMAYLFSVPLPEFLEESDIAPDSEIELTSNLEQIKKVKTTQKGTVVDEEGKEYTSLYNAIQSSQSEEKVSWLDARNLTENEDLFEKMKGYRLGKKKF